MRLRLRAQGSGCRARGSVILSFWGAAEQFFFQEYIPIWNKKINPNRNIFLNMDMNMNMALKHWHAAAEIRGRYGASINTN